MITVPITPVDDETLVAFVDGELPERQRAEVEQAVGADPALARLVAGLRADQLLIRSAFEVAQPRPTEPTEQADGTAVVLPFRPAARRGWAIRTLLPLAAAVTGIVVGAGVTLYMQPGGGAGDLANLAFANQSERLEALQSSLETSPSGTAVSWRDDGSESHGTLTVVRTFRGPDGSFCREFREEMVTSDTQLHVIGIACREGESWRTKVQVIES
jgi:anti-sigma factor RsiW